MLTHIINHKKTVNNDQTQQGGVQASTGGAVQVQDPAEAPVQNPANAASGQANAAQLKVPAQVPAAGAMQIQDLPPQSADKVMEEVQKEGEGDWLQKEAGTKTVADLEKEAQPEVKMKTKSVADLEKESSTEKPVAETAAEAPGQVAEAKPMEAAEQDAEAEAKGAAEETGDSTPAKEGTESEKDKAAKEAQETAEKKKKADQELKTLQEAILAANVPQMVLMLISYALSLGASDIHIEPMENQVRLRYRIDGVLRIIVEYPLNLHPAVVSRIKIMSNLKIDEQRIPQDGRAEVTTKEGRTMDLRVSTLPTVNGEKIVMRIQDKSRKIPELMELGIKGISLENILEALKMPNGIIINTGPTGSGKTTTLYSCMNRINTPDINIMTIEDPVEIQLDGLAQSQVHHEIDYNFATGMRAALRQDPDVIMVGEMRDKETADTAIEAALTGHLVFSTLHTNSAVESITRLLNMGVHDYLLNSTIRLIIAQRLVRRICEHCKEPAETPPEMMALVKKALSTLYIENQVAPDLLEKMQFYKGKGCDKCNNIGYKGRVGLYEVFKMNNELRKLISEHAPIIDLEDAAKKGGMITLEQYGILRALEGMTTLDEVYRVAAKSE